jgi:hypothetical protein
MTVPVFMIERRFADDLEASAEVADRINRINEEEGVRQLAGSADSGGRRSLATACVRLRPV